MKVLKILLFSFKLGCPSPNWEIGPTKVKGKSQKEDMIYKDSVFSVLVISSNGRHSSTRIGCCRQDDLPDMNLYKLLAKTML